MHPSAATVNGTRRVPPPVNEPIKSYAPGSPEKAELKSRLSAMSGECPEIPVIVGGKEIRTGDVTKVRSPHDHQHVIATFHKARPEDVTAAIAAAAAAQKEWASWRWEDRAAWLTTAELGKATTVKVTIIGKPGKPVERQGFTLVRMSHTPRLDTMPKGLPIPTKVPETPYVLYIGAKQWRKVADALKNPEDVLICEGVQTWDAQYQVLTVFVTTCTTKLLQQAQRPTPPPAKA